MKFLRRYARVPVYLLLLFVFLRFTEHVLLFQPQHLPQTVPDFGPGVVHTWHDLPEGRVDSFLLMPLRNGAPATNSAPVPLLIVAHGSGDLTDIWVHQVEAVRTNGLAVLLTEYPGFGRCTGRPSEAAIQATQAAAYDWATAQPGINKNAVIGYGHSLGGAVIASLGRVRPLAAICLVSTFTSTSDMAWSLYRIPGFFVHNTFNTLDFVKSYSGPLLLLHGSHDSVVPFEHSQRLAKASPKSLFIALDCDHNDMPPPGKRLLRFLQKNGLIKME